MGEAASSTRVSPSPPSENVDFRHPPGVSDTASPVRVRRVGPRRR
ncbi:hypothetical protein SCAB_53942 [Streptomyces scabiei 87.22]|uniref:Uncharacterized protein n=1 Tax=Streptomyces scabiei (strain 87.22) TaxID=680198 RepID=C9YXZ1_STRSW|nr:hypothetical protein SCAB_53942 [Streptomyces scabiei 87.22]